MTHEFCDGAYVDTGGNGLRRKSVSEVVRPYAAREAEAQNALTDGAAGVSSAEISLEQGAARPQTEETGHGRYDDEARRDAAGAGLGERDGGAGMRSAAEPAGRRGSVEDGGGTAGHAAEDGDGAGGRRRTRVKVPQREDEPATYELVEAGGVLASHLPEAGFQKTPGYALENERRYHDEPASQRKVQENAANLDPAFLLESVDANHGAPVIDRQGNVLGGNGRAMSVRLAYENFPQRAAAYREALRGAARRLGLDPARVDDMERPVLVRRLERDLGPEERQKLVSALNGTFQDSEGNTQPGILLPRDADPRKLVEDMDVSLSPETALRFLRELPGKSAVKTADKLLVMSYDGTDFTVSVPSSKARGAQFFLNGAVLEAAGRDFVKSGQSMTLRHISGEQALGVLRALSSQGYGFVADNNKDVARGMAAEGPRASLASRHERGPVVVRGADLNVPEGAGLSEYIKAAKRFHDDLKAESENGRPVINMSPEFAGKPIRFSGKGWRKNVNAGADVRKWQMFSALRAILERASYVRTETTEGRADDFTKSHWFECDVELNGEKLRSGFTLLEDVNGNLFYNLNADISRNANKKAPRSLKPNAQSWGHGTLSRQVNYAPDETSIGDTDNSVNLHLLPQEAAGRFLPQREAGARPLPASREALRRVVDKLNARAANGADVRLADTMDDLPANLRKAFDGKAVEGVYDPETGTVWLVADQMGDPQRAAEVWAHETLAHHGLRALLNAGERKLLLNQLWLQMGGMGHPLIAETARRYGIDPRSDVEGRLTVMEEALAKLAERRAKGLLNAPDKAPEQSLWRRVVAAVLRAWQGLVKRLTGREGSMDAAGMERLLDSLQGYVMDGRPVEGAARTPDGNAAKENAEERPTASLDSDRKAAAHAAWRQLQRDTEQWARQVENFEKSTQPRKLLEVCRTPDVLLKLKEPDVPMVMTAGNLAKILSDKADHQLPKSLVAQLPAALAEPVMIFESATVSDALVVLTDLTHEGRPVMVAIHPDVERQNIQVHDITSAYKRAREWFLRQMEAGRLLYQDKKKSLAWARTNGLQLPKVRKLPAKLENRLLTEADIVKPEAPTKEAPLASLRSAPDGGAREQAAAVARRLRAIAGRGVSEDVEELLRDPEQGRLIPREDLGKLERLCKLPHWIAKDHPKFAAIYDRQLRRVDERRAALLDATSRVPLLFDGDAKARLNAAEYLPAAKPAGEGAQALTY